MPRQGRRAVRRRARGAGAGGRGGVRAIGSGFGRSRTPSDLDRRALRATLDAAVGRLVARAAVEGWPVRADHCFLRIAYDNAVGARWDTVHARPAWASLPLARLTAAIAVLAAIEAEGRAALGPLNAASLAFRRAAR